MVHAVVMDVPAPVEMYDAIDAELLRHDVTSIDGLILQQYDRYNRDMVGPIMARIVGGQTVPPPNPTVINLHGLVIPHAPVAL